LPHTESPDPGLDTVSARIELADLIAEVTGGLSDHDRAVLELAYRHGLKGPELAEALGASPDDVNKVIYRLRQTIEVSLGGLLMSRRARNTPDACPALAAISGDCDGFSSVTMRKIIARHIESCPTCDMERRRLVTPTALLDTKPVFIPAPTWLRDRTLREVQLTLSATATTNDIGEPGRSGCHTRRGGG
jgi:hypothetical protein